MTRHSTFTQIQDTPSAPVPSGAFCNVGVIGMTTGQALRIARERAGMIQWQAAQQLCIDRVTLHRYEHDKLAVPEDIAYAAMVLYGSPLPVAAYMLQHSLRLVERLMGVAA